MTEHPGVWLERSGGQLWLRPMIPGPARRTGLRIGDVERDRAMAALGDHFAAGRLNREEFDERVDRAMTARFDRDLSPLFDDLPSTSAHAREARSATRPSALFALAPLLWVLPLLVVVVAVAGVVLTAPWVLWGLVWIMVLSRFWRHHHHPHRGHYPGRRR